MNKGSQLQTKACLYRHFIKREAFEMIDITFVRMLLTYRWMRRRYAEAVLRRLGVSHRNAVIVASRWVP